MVEACGKQVRVEDVGGRGGGITSPGMAIAGIQVSAVLRQPAVASIDLFDPCCPRLISEELRYTPRDKGVRKGVRGAQTKEIQSQADHSTDEGRLKSGGELGNNQSGPGNIDLWAPVDKRHGILRYHYRL